MFGKELRQNVVLAEPITYEIVTNKDGNLEYRYTTSQGDNILMIFTSPKKTLYSQAAKRAWETVITEYSILPTGEVYLLPNAYWTIFKKIPGGREILYNTGSILFINGRGYRFPKPTRYFDGESGFREKGIYSITYQNQLLYIGSSTTLTERWKQHDAAFLAGVGGNQMYSQGYNADEIEYQVLESEADILQRLGLKDVSMWVIELIESTYITILKPLWNHSGVKAPFTFQAQSADLPVSYWEIVQNVLLEDNIVLKEQLKQGVCAQEQ